MNSRTPIVEVEVFVTIPVPYIFDISFPYFYKVEVPEDNTTLYGKIEIDGQTVITVWEGSYSISKQRFNSLKETDLGNYLFDKYESSEEEFYSVKKALIEFTDNV